MNLRTTIHRTAIAASITAVAAVGSVAPATADSPDDRGAEITSASQLTSTKPVNVVGVPMRIPVPGNWAVTSPRQLAMAKPARYPLAIRTQARVEHQSPAQWVAANKEVSVYAVLSPRHSFSQGIAVVDLAGQSYPFATLKRTAREAGTVTGTSQVRTRFGVAQRVHYVSTHSPSGLRYQGVVALMNVKGHSVMVSTVGLTAAAARYPNDLALRGATPR